MSRAPKTITLLMGGMSPEREASLVGGEACAGALKALGYKVEIIDAGADLPRFLAETPCDLVFNALHGSWGEDGCVQGMFEWMRIPYTHSGVLASALAMHKEHAKGIFAAEGIPVAPSRVGSREEAASKHLMEPPYVVKPITQGSSVGVLIAPEGANAPPAELSAKDWQYGDDIMVERYIPGREITCAIMDGRSLGVMEIVPHKGQSFYDYRAKYEEGRAEHIVPADLDKAVYEAIEDAAVRAHQALGCRGVTRADFRYDDASKAFFLLEINTQPGMTPLSLLPEIAAHDGISFPDLVRWIAEDASTAR